MRGNSVEAASPAPPPAPRELLRAIAPAEKFHRSDRESSSLISAFALGCCAKCGAAPGSSAPLRAGGCRCCCSDGAGLSWVRSVVVLVRLLCDLVSRLPRPPTVGVACYGQRRGRLHLAACARA